MPARGIPGAVFIVRLVAQRIFPNCPRYIHKMQLVEESPYAPRPQYTPPVPRGKPSMLQGCTAAARPPAAQK
jgi:hypothetical protein